MYQTLADFVMWFHMFWGVLLIGGLIFSLKYSWYVPIQGLFIATTVTADILFLGCPLSLLESALRMKYDSRASYSGSFTCHYLKEYFGIILPPQIIVLMLVVIALAYLLVLIKHNNRRC